MSCLGMFLNSRRCNAEEESSSPTSQSAQDLKQHHHSLVDRNLDRFPLIQFSQSTSQAAADDISASVHDQPFEQFKVDVQWHAPLAGDADAGFDFVLLQASKTGIVDHLVAQPDDLVDGGSLHRIGFFASAFRGIVIRRSI